jgi:uncharacterized membrane protein YeaQ/YmgE (transglycosylase-associated protein family)
MLGVIAAALERRILPHSAHGSFLGSLFLAWAGAALGSLLAALLGIGPFGELNLWNSLVAVAGMVLILGGFRLARRGRSAESRRAA